MEIKTVHRPWEKKSTAFSRRAPDPYYQSAAWKKQRQAHINGTTSTPYGTVENKYCIDCYLESKGINKIPMHTADHPIPITEGGDRHQPLRSLCKRHNFTKTAQDRNRQYSKRK